MAMVHFYLLNGRGAENPLAIESSLLLVGHRTVTRSGIQHPQKGALRNILRLDRIIQEPGRRCSKPPLDAAQAVRNQQNRLSAPLPLVPISRRGLSDSKARIPALLTLFAIGALMHCQSFYRSITNCRPLPSRCLSRRHPPAFRRDQRTIRFAPRANGRPRPPFDQAHSTAQIVRSSRAASVWGHRIRAGFRLRRGGGVALRLRFALRFSPSSAPLSRSPTADRSQKVRIGSRAVENANRRFTNLGCFNQRLKNWQAIRPPFHNDKSKILTLNLRNRMIFRAADEGDAIQAADFLGKKHVVKRSWGFSAGKRNVNNSETEEHKIKPHKLRNLREHECVLVHCERGFRRVTLLPIEPDGSISKWFSRWRRIL